MLKKFFAMLWFGLLAPINAHATSEVEMVKLFNYVEAQASCSAYIGHMSSNYKGAGFASDKEAGLAGDEHRRLASYASEKLINLLMTQDIEGKRLGVRKGNQFCLDVICLSEVSTCGTDLRI